MSPIPLSVVSLLYAIIILLFMYANNVHHYLHISQVKILEEDDHTQDHSLQIVDEVNVYCLSVSVPGSMWQLMFQATKKAKVCEGTLEILLGDNKVSKVVRNLDICRCMLLQNRAKALC